VSSLWWGSFFFWPKAEGPYAHIIKRSRRRLAVFLAVATTLITLAILFRWGFEWQF
jgi:hypothetical protein